MKIWRKSNKRILETWLMRSAMFLLCMLCGCARGMTPPGEAEGKSGGRLRVVTTLFPYYDFTRQVAGESVELFLVIPAGMDSHSFEPTPADIRLLQSADVIICNGGAMEQWLDRVLAALDSSQITVVHMMDHVNVVEEEIVEGMEDEGHMHEGHLHDEHVQGGQVHGETDGYAEGGERGEADEAGYGEIEYDEHIWTSPVNAMEITRVIAETLSEADAKNAAVYMAGYEEYRTKLAALDAEFRQIRADAVHDTIVVGDKFPLRYFADAYGLRYRAAFSGCSTDTEPSARTIAGLIERVRHEELPAVYYLELSSSRVAEIIAEETGAQPLLFHSCHNVTRREFENGVTYLELMEQNAENLKEGLLK